MYNRKWTTKDFDGWLYAHRGYHREPDAPENSLAAFRLAVENGYGAELDVHLLKDGSLGILHDSKLRRITGRKGIIENLTADDLSSYRLGNSTETIPLLRQVLDIFDGKAPLIIELKPYKNNAAALTEAVCRELDSYDGPFCLESFHPEVLMWLKKNRPDLLRGQLSMNYIKEREGLTFVQAVIGTWLLHGFLTRPDFIAYQFPERKNLGNRFWLHVMKKSGAAWTLHTPEELKEAQREGLWPIFENFDPVTGKRLPGAKDT